MIYNQNIEGIMLFRYALLGSILFLYVVLLGFFAWLYLKKEKAEV